MEKKKLRKISLFFIYCSFFFCGVINNFVYCFVLSAAKDILESDSKYLIPVGVILISNILPGLLAQYSAPFWMDKFSYLFRVCLFVLGQVISIAFVAFIPNIFAQLGGMIIGGFTSSLGESSFLSMTSSFFPGVVTAWGSGTGGAGLLGSLTYLLLHAIIGLDYHYANMVVLWVPFVYLFFFVAVLRKYVVSFSTDKEKAAEKKRIVTDDADSDNVGFTGLVYEESAERNMDSSMIGDNVHGSLNREKQIQVEEKENVKRFGSVNGDVAYSEEGQESLLDDDIDENKLSVSTRPHTLPGPVSTPPHSSPPPPFSFKQRAKALLHLLPRIFPLFLVYVAEYLINQGVAPELVYPKETFIHPNEYVYYAFIYQVGVFIGRSSTSVVRVRKTLLCSIVQVIILVFFVFECYFRFLPTIYISFVLTLFEGVIGGTVYSNTFYLLNENKDAAPPHIRMFELGAGAMASSGGITVAALLALFVQPLLHKYKR